MDEAQQNAVLKKRAISLKNKIKECEVDLSTFKREKNCRNYKVQNGTCFLLI